MEGSGKRKKRSKEGPVGGEGRAGSTTMVDLLLVGAAGVRPVSVGVHHDAPSQRRATASAAGNGVAVRHPAAASTPE